MLRACMAESLPRPQIKKLLGVTEKGLGIIEKRLLANDGQLMLNMSSAYRFYTYVLQQEQCARDLDFIQRILMNEIKLYHDEYKRRLEGDVPCDDEGNMLEAPDLPPKPSPQAAIMAIKAKSEILDRTIKTGQELGIIDKRAKEVRVSGSVNLAAMPTEELKVALQERLDEFQNLVGSGELPTVYQRMIAGRQQPHDRARLRGRDGSNLDPDIGTPSS